MEGATHGSAGDGSGRLGVVTGLVPDGGHHLLLAEPGPGGECPAEVVVVSQHLADLGCQLGFAAPQYRPGVQPGPAAINGDAVGPPDGPPRVPYEYRRHRLASGCRG